MSEHDFTLKFAIPAELEKEDLEARLFENGCDDALLGVGQKGRLALDFTREAESLGEAVSTAVRDVTDALPEAQLIEAEAAPDRIAD